jgi:TRAP-type mannitol/chloroaromatic compound transport system permease small subunit
VVQCVLAYLLTISFFFPQHCLFLYVFYVYNILVRKWRERNKRHFPNWKFTDIRSRASMQETFRKGFFPGKYWNFYFPAKIFFSGLPDVFYVLAHEISINFVFISLGNISHAVHCLSFFSLHFLEAMSITRRGMQPGCS